MQACMHFCMQLGRCTVPVASLTILEPDLGFMMDNSPSAYWPPRALCHAVRLRPGPSAATAYRSVCSKQTSDL